MWDRRRAVRPMLRASEVAILRDGPRAAVLAALAALRVDGLVEASYGRVVRSIGQVEPDRDPVERVVHAAALDVPLRVTAFPTHLMVAIELDEVQASAARNGPRKAGHRARRRELNRLRRQYEQLAPDRRSSGPAQYGTAQDAAMAVALFGEDALMAFDPTFAVTVLGEPPQKQAPGRQQRERSRLGNDGTEPGSGVSYTPQGWPGGT